MLFRFFCFLKNIKKKTRKELLDRSYIISEARPFFADLAARVPSHNELPSYEDLSRERSS
jgi:hypothetical protein